MTHRRVPGLEQYPDLVKRFEHQIGRALSGDCGGCKVKEVIETFTGLVRSRQKRDNDFRKR